MKGKTLGVLAFVLVLFSCQKEAPTMFSNLKIERDVIELRVHLYDTPAQLRKEIGQKTGLSKWSPNDNICDVWVVKGDMATMGHEVHHCIYGAWHKE